MYDKNNSIRYLINWVESRCCNKNLSNTEGLISSAYTKYMSTDRMRLFMIHPFGYDDDHAVSNVKIENLSVYGSKMNTLDDAKVYIENAKRISID